MKIAVANDHAGVNLKPALLEYLKERGDEVIDFGTNDTEKVDYPEYSLKVALAVKSGEADKGILICGTGIGMSIVANKVPGIRCACCSEVFSAEVTVAHNNSNIISFGGRVVDEEKMREMVRVFLDTKFIGGRHQVRVDKITEVEKTFSK
ncbi:MAG: ribose 5-phosphate isomerase B [Clostridiales bacterium]|nr:ribose 5-phosphate isomerase B [Clostridiales bacterium]